MGGTGHNLLEFLKGISLEFLKGNWQSKSQSGQRAEFPKGVILGLLKGKYKGKRFRKKEDMVAFIEDILLKILKGT